jgi:Methyltransferase FkbM domain
MEGFLVYQCPYPKQRLGKPNDGGYVIASLPGQYDLCLSGGVLDDISFEEHFVTLYPTTCYAFDGTVDSIPTKNVHFVKKNVAAETTSTTTNFQEYMVGKENVFLKMDIEGHEFRILPAMIQNGDIRKVKQLIMEIHTPADIKLAPHYYKGLQDITNETMFQLMKQLSQTHTIVHFHANNAPPMQRIDNIDVPHVFELTLIRNDYIPHKIRNTETFPTRLDMKNWQHKPEYYFSGFPYTT